MYCAKCQKKISETVSVCPNCGGTEFSEKKRTAKYSPACIIWMLISLLANAGLGVYFMFMAIVGTNPNIKLVFQPPFVQFTLDDVGGFNLVLFLMGLLVVLYSLVYIILMFAKKQYLYGVLMVAAIALASFMFFFYGASLLSILMIPVLVVFPSVTKTLIGDEWDYMG